MISYGKQVYSGSIEVQYGVTGSLLGTASNAITATNAISASVIPIVAGENIFINRVGNTYQISSSAAVDTGSFVQNSQTSSFVNINQTGSFLVSASIDEYTLTLHDASGSTLVTELPQPLDNGAVFSFASSDTWTIGHNLDQLYPQVEVYEASTNSQVRPNQIISIDENTVEVQFTVPVEGYANVSRAGNYIISTSGSVNAAGVSKIIAGDNIGIFPSTGTGDVTISFSGSVVPINLPDIQTISFDSLSSANMQGSGEVVYFGTSPGLNPGFIYYLSSTGQWELSNADIASTGTQLLAVALGTEVSDGMLLKGNARFMGVARYDMGTTGQPLYLNILPGEFQTTAPSGLEDVTRIIGYTVDSSIGLIYFNPSSTWTIPSDAYTV